MQSISLAQAQKIALLSQGLPAQKLTGTAYQKSVQSMQTLGYVQIDTISVVQRAHHHTLWSRNHSYAPEHLDRMVKERLVYEYWSHAASYLDMENFRFSLPRKHAIKSDKQNHWFRKNPKLMSEVLARITSDGPLMAKDFDSTVTKKTGWESKPTKQALEMLYMQGDLMITERKNFHKVYDLTERVLPSSINTTTPSALEYAKFLVINSLVTHGLATLAEITYLQKGMKASVNEAINQLIEEGEIDKVSVNGEIYFTRPQSLSLLDKRLNRKQTRILSPFDNLVIQRDRVSKLFNFDYLLECYVPATKRQHGYFVLPILWDGRLVARADCKAHRKEAHLEVITLHIEPSANKQTAFKDSLELELTQFAHFNGCATFSITRQIP
ncbi:winged helix-turn-helix domain-containing protein [Vibrio maritimus]|uniref:winged helix-turn-helix domain-containing protein n=1 Tax=Vibrio maritimus TaxID=990268 RepID=UPI0037356331